MKKKGFITLEWLVEILKEILPVILVIAIVIGGIAVIWRATETSPQDQDFKRVLDAYDALVADFEERKITSDAEYKVGITSENPFQIAFYPEGGYAMPPVCKGRTCLCMYYITTGGKKETCKTLDIRGKCTKLTCGAELCAGEYKEFAVKKGDAVQVAVACTDKGTQLRVDKV